MTLYLSNETNYGALNVVHWKEERRGEMEEEGREGEEEGESE